MNEFQTINDSVAESVRSSSYVTVVISSCVFVIYTLIIRLIDFFKSKNKNKPLYEMANAIKENTSNIVKLNQVLDKVFREAETKELSRITSSIETTFDSFKAAVLSQCIDIVVHNNILNHEDTIKQTIYKKVSTEYYRMYATLSLYEHKGSILSSKLKEDWIDAITLDCFTVIYENDDVVTRIRHINNKLTIDVEEYSIYLNNKILNN